MDAVNGTGGSSDVWFDVEGLGLKELSSRSERGCIALAGAAWGRNDRLWTLGWIGDVAVGVLA